MASLNLPYEALRCLISRHTKFTWGRFCEAKHHDTEFCWFAARSLRYITYASRDCLEPVNWFVRTMFSLYYITLSISSSAAEEIMLHCEKYEPTLRHFSLYVKVNFNRSIATVFLSQQRAQLLKSYRHQSRPDRLFLVRHIKFVCWFRLTFLINALRRKNDLYLGRRIVWGCG